jgi:hypothetical protein
MSAPGLLDAALELADAATDVVATWEGGNLAEAVRWLDEALRVFNAAYSQSGLPSSPCCGNGLEGSSPT